MKKCVLCGHVYSEDDLCEVASAEDLAEICTTCYRDTEECPECREHVISEEGICPLCQAEV